MVFLASDFYQKQPIWFQKTQQGCFKPSQTKHFSSPWSTRFCEQLDIIELWIFRMSSLLYNKHYVALIILYQCCFIMFLQWFGHLVNVAELYLCSPNKIVHTINMHCVSSICNAYMRYALQSDNFPLSTISSATIYVNNKNYLCMKVCVFAHSICCIYVHLTYRT